MARQQVAEFNQSTRILGAQSMDVGGGIYPASVAGMIYLPPVGDNLYKLHSLAASVFPASLPASGVLLGYYIAIVACTANGWLTELLGLGDLTFQDFPGSGGDADLKWMVFADEYNFTQDFNYPIVTRPGQGLAILLGNPYATGDAVGTPTYDAQATLSVRGVRESILGEAANKFKVR